MIWLDWSGTKIIVRTLHRGGAATMTETPGEQQQGQTAAEAQAAADRAQEAAAPTQADAEAQDTTTTQDGEQGEPQPA